MILEEYWHVSFSICISHDGPIRLIVCVGYRVKFKFSPMFFSLILYMMSIHQQGFIYQVLFLRDNPNALFGFDT